MPVNKSRSSVQIIKWKLIFFFEFELCEIKKKNMYTGRMRYKSSVIALTLLSAGLSVNFFIDLERKDKSLS